MTEAKNSPKHAGRWLVLPLIVIAGVLASCVLAWVALRVFSTPQRASVFLAHPNSDVIAFETERDDGPQIYVMNPDGTQQTRLTYSVRMAPEWWLPMTVVGGDRIPFILLPSLGQNGTVVFRTIFEGPYATYSIFLDGTQQTRLSTMRADDPTAVWSPTKQELAFVTSEGKITIMAGDGSGQHCITCVTVLNVTDIAWSPDGQQLAFTGAAGGNTNIYRINRDGSGLMMLTHTGRLNADPAWSWDSQRIAFRSDQQDGHSHIYVMQADGSTVQQLTTSAGNDLYPAWSPDGQRLTFTSYTHTAGGTIYVMNADGSGQQALTTAPGKHGRSVWIHVPATYCQSHACAK